MAKLKLYTDVSILPVENSHTYILFQKLGNYLKTAGDPDSDRFDDYCREAGTYFEFVEYPVAADYFLLPFGFSFEDVYQQKMLPFLEKARSFNKKTILFYNSDDDTDIDLQDVVIFRTSYYRSKHRSNTYALPGWSVDFAKYFPNNQFSVLPYNPKPSVSYCGYIDKKPDSFKAIIRSFIKKEPFSYEAMARELRGKGCRILQANKNIDTDFIIRDGFWAQGIADKNKARHDYAENMINSLYGIVTRGAGNFSYRLIEMMSAGRIPVFIDTDSMLPYDTLIDWKQHVVWLDQKDIDKIDKIVLDYHKSKTEEQLRTIQQNNRNLYLEYLGPNGFLKNLHLLLLNRV